MSDPTLWLTKYLIAGVLLLIGWLGFWLVAAACRAVRWCWRCAAKVVAHG